MYDESNNKGSKKIIGFIMKIMRPYLIVGVIIILVLGLLAGLFHFFTNRNGIENPDDKKNGPAAARNLINNTNIGENGNIELGETIQETWDKLKKQGNAITTYLNSAQELAKLITAASALDYPDTRENPDAPIDWNDIDINSKDVQGIVKFKRALSDGNTITMKYVSPSKFNKLVNNYLSSGSEKDRNEALKYFTVERTAAPNSSEMGDSRVKELLTYACSWVGKVPYKSVVSGDANNGERFLPLKEGRASDCSHFIHWVFAHVGLMEGTQDYFNKYGHSHTWGLGGDAGGCPGTVKIGTDLSQASPGDVLWWHFGDGANNHVAIYLGRGKMVECAAGHGVIISNVSSGFDQILHFTQLPTDPTGYYDPDTKTLHSSISGSSNGEIKKVPSLQGMVFMGDSILSAIRARTSLEKGEGAITMYQSGCSAEFFLGEQDCTDNSDTNCRSGRYFDWNKQFSNINNPTGFYLMLGQNFFEDKSHRIERMDRLVQKIRSQYPSAPIYISSVLRYLKRNNSARTREVKEATLAMNEELKNYCLSNSSNNVFYSDVLKGYDESDEMLISHTYDDDHPNEEGARILLSNIKANIVSQSSNMDISSDEEVLKITAIDFRAIPNSGWGDGIMLSSNGYNLLMDTFREQCRESLDKYLKENNINKFDIYISHDHHDHADNLYYLIENYNVSRVYVPNIGGAGLFNVDKLRRMGVEVVKLEKGMTFEIGSQNCVAEVIYGPDTSAWSDSRGDPINNMSLVTMIRTKTRIGDVRYLTGGDIEEGAAKKILEQGIDIKADIMKADHHGGGDTPKYIKEVNPSFYLIDYLDKYDSWVQPQVDAAEECGNVFSTYNNGEVSFSIKASGNIVPSAQRNVEQVEFSAQDDSGKTYTATFTLNKDSSHILTERMKEALTNTKTKTIKNTIYKVKVATWQDCKETVVSKGNGDKKKDEYVEESSEYTYSMNVRTIPFQDIVAQYKMPFNYLWDMLLISEDKRYVFDLADTVRNSKIEITVFDNLKETTTVKTENYVRNYDYTGKMSGTLTGTVWTGPNNSQTVSGSDSDEYTLKKPYVFKKIRTIFDRTNNLDIALTLADAWCVKYQKNYKYNGKTSTIGHPSEVTLEDMKEEPITSETITNSELRNILIGMVKGKIQKRIFVSGGQFTVTSESQVLNISVTNRILTTEVSTAEYKYLAVPENATDNNSSVASGYLYSTSYSQIDTSKLNRSGIQQGFCLAGDYYAYVTEVNEVSTLYLVDKNTNKQVDAIKGIYGHGNTLAYDSKEEQIIYIQDKTENMLIYKIENGKLKYSATRRLPKHDAGGVYVRSDLAYNEQSDKFILGKFVYKRASFYNRGSPEVKIEYTKPDNTELQGSCSYGNHVFYNYSSANHKSGNYLIVCNILTGIQDEIIYDDMPLELEEGSFDKDGNLYLMYGKTQLYAIPYRYYTDGNIDVRKANNTSYSVGGNFYENNKFINVFNAHSSARSNVLRNPDWLFNMLENNADTVNMVDLTKYLMYKASGIDFGVTEFQFQAYGMNGVGTQGSILSITSTTFTKEQFVQLVQSYSGAINKGAGTKTFRDNAAVIYDVCTRNNINPVLCAAQAWKEQNWNDPSTSPYNFWGIAVYNGQNYGKSWGSMEAAVQGYCDQINSQLNGRMKSTYQARAQQFASVNGKFIGDMSTIYDIFSAYAYIGAGHTLKEEADYAANYVDSLMKCATQIFGEGALTAAPGGGSDVVQFALRYEGKTAPEFGLFSYTSRCGARDIWYSSEWCAMFVSFCFDSCNKIPNPLPNSFASCSNGWSLIGSSRQRASACRGGNYIPKPGDIIFYGSGAGSHTGIVESCDGNTVNTIEGNTGNSNNSLSRVNRRSRSINDGWIWGYGVMSN